jgi:excisionase family DNA binding protein
MTAAALAHSIADAAALIGVGRTTAYALIADGELRTITVGRRRLVPQCELESFIARRLGEGGSGG